MISSMSTPSNLAALGGELTPGQWLGQDIGDVVRCRDLLDLDQSQGDVVSYKVDSMRKGLERLILEEKEFES